MAKYCKFHYSAGYCGTDEEQIVKFDDNISEKEISDTFEDWYDSVNTSSGGYDEISEKEAEDEGIDEDYTY